MTEQRRIILEELRKLRTHPTANEVYEIVRRRLPRISLGTVYRNLEILSETGMILKLEMAGTQKRFDGKTENHYHVRCLGCGRVDDVAIEPISLIDSALDGVSDYRIVWHRLEFMGFCPKCQFNMNGVLKNNSKDYLGNNH
ncbi:Fur family transcriptional regulator [Desulfomonile tiedjei]|nr:transcriptional repressor [Desulfomonile tiedjei]